MRRALFVARIYVKLIATHQRAHFEYRADFWIGIVGMGLTHGAPLFFIWAVFLQVPEIGGWTAWEVALLYALTVLSLGTIQVVCEGPWVMWQLLNQGGFDHLLVRPISPAVQLLTWASGIHGYGSLVVGGVVLARAKAELALDWAPWQWGFLVIVVLGSTILTGALNFATNCIGFWEPAATNGFPYLIAQAREFVKFPLTVYGRPIQFVLTWILPYAFISYFPVAVLLERPDANPWLGYASPLVGVVVAGMTAIVWRRGLGRYQSTRN
jgi:ABC-2 type transport system permease protein